MADLVSLDDFKTFLGGIDGDSQDDLLQGLLDGVEDEFEAECNRTDRPFQAGKRIRCELHDGTGTPAVFADYPIARLRAITIGADPDNPDETLDPDDFTVVAWAKGKCKIHRVDGGTFGCAGSPNILRLEYDSLDDLPPRAPLAIKRFAAAIYRQRGAEDATSESTGGSSRTLKFSDEPFHDDIIWKRAVKASKEPRV